MVGNFHDDGHVVLDQQDRCAIVVTDAAQQIVQFVRLARVKAGGRLIETKQRRLRHHGAGDFEPALRAIRQGAGGIVGTRCQSDALQPGPRLVESGGLASPIGGQAE